jgi:carboxymethylenebutenolidase
MAKANDRSVSESVANIPTADGVMWAFHAFPAAPGPHPPVILYQDAPGIREELKGFARRMAQDGFFCLLPDMYYRVGSLRFRLSHRDAAMSAVIKSARNTLTHPMVKSDTAAMLDWLGHHSQAKSDAVGTVGYCQGGRFSLAAAGNFPDRIRAAATLYGTELVTDEVDSPHLLAGRMRGELYLGFAEHDPMVLLSVIPVLRKGLDANRKVTYAIETYPGTRHGFCFPEREVYHKKSAEIAWSRLADLFARQLKG